MNTVMLRSKVRKGADKNTFSIEVLGESSIKDDIKVSIRSLEYHPANVSRRTIIDMLGLIEKHNLKISFAERNEDEDGLETWCFILQG